ncbi:ABC transporter ATP-binding protein [Novosphingobium sp.]|uniref:ABC transporter ATP-binding protein n=1 Tax=Novosphingobium sp. TaxID=1874826 RepID=UPI0038B75389
MIIARNISKRYRTAHGAGRWVLENVSFTIPPKLSVGIVGSNGAGKSTLLRILAGVDKPTRGEVDRQCRVSWPLGFGGGLQGTLTGRQNSKFVCRIHGHEDDIPERLARIEEFAALGKAFNEPIRTYSTGMTARLRFAISLAFDFDVYISDEATSAGDASFRQRAADEFKRRANEASVIMVSHDASTLRRFCSAGLYIHGGKAHWFDNLDDALRAYKDTLPR